MTLTICIIILKQDQPILPLSVSADIRFSHMRGFSYSSFRVVFYLTNPRPLQTMPSVANHILSLLRLVLLDTRLVSEEDRLFFFIEFKPFTAAYSIKNRLI